MDHNHVVAERPTSQDNDIAYRNQKGALSAITGLSDNAMDVGLAKIDREAARERRRGEDAEHPRQLNINMSPQLIGKTMTPFMKSYIPSLYAPLTKTIKDEDVNPGSHLDANTRYCYRHRPDSKCRRAADESKMVAIQSELDLLPAADQQAITHVWSLFSASPAKHRDLMLQGIMTQCCFPQLSRVAREVQEQLKIDFITALPAELSFKIFCYLDATSLCRASQVSTQWRNMADDERVWHKICEQHIDRKCTKCGFGLPLLERRRLKEWTKQQQLAKSRQEEVDRPRVPVFAPTLPAPNTPRSPSPPKRDARELEDAAEPKRRCLSKVGSDESVSTISATATSVTQREERRFRGWKTVYKERFRVGFNWKYGRCTVKVFKGHTNGVTCVHMDDNIMATGSYDATIRIWDIATGREIRQLRGHTRGIRSLQFDDKILVSGSLDGTVKIWNYHTGVQLNTLMCDPDGVISVNLMDEYLAVGCIGKTVKVFNLRTKESFCLKGHSDWVNQVKIDTASRTLFSASDDFKVKLWDLDTKRCIRTFVGHVGHVQQVLPLPPDFELDDLPYLSLDNTDATSVASARSATPALMARNPSFTGQHSSQGLETTSSSSPPAADVEPRTSYGARFQQDNNAPLPARYILSGALDSTIRW
jgi:F-box and WD-40 domain protein MET30